MNDLISRQAAIDFVGSMNMCDEISNEAYKKLTSYLDELPSAEPEPSQVARDIATILENEKDMRVIAAQPEPKTGKWIPCDVDIRGMTNMFVCSKCGSFTSLPILKYANAMEYDFCPNCGADMRGEKDE